MAGNNAGPRKRDAFRILVTDDSSDSRAAEDALDKKGLSFVKQNFSKETQDTYKAPCLISGEGRFSGRQMIEGYALTIDEQVERGR